MAEKEESLRSVSLEKAKLEAEAEGFNQRLRSLDESEHRYKDENWNLETQIHEHIAAAKNSADREKKLAQSLNALQTEKSAAQKELDEIKLVHSRLAEDHAAAVKHHDTELGGVKRNMTMVENERGALQRKIEELTGQNQELAMAISSQRGRADARDQERGLSDEDFETANDNVTPEHSPPPSPVKGTPRHSMLESETLKSSLHHAHRMIQNLKGNIHREKTEKLELKRMLQDARDELDARRGDGLGSSTNKRSRKVESKEFKKPLKPGQLGGLRTSQNEILVDDANWEDQQGEGSPTHSRARKAALAAAGAAGGVAMESSHDSSDHFDTANETSDAFETANERGTETEDFHTGAEEISGSDELTETEELPATGGTLRGKKPPNLSLHQPGNRSSMQSTASNSDDEFAYEDVKTPVQSQPQRMRLKVGRGGIRRSRVDSEEPNFNSSPASFATSSNNTPQAPGQSLFAELGDMGGSDDESMEGTPSRSLASPGSRPSTAGKGMASPRTIPPPLPKAEMVDSGMMTDAWEPAPLTPQTALPWIAGAGLAGAGVTELAHVIADEPQPSTPQQLPKMSDAASQWHDDQMQSLLMPEPSTSGRPISTSTYSDMSSQADADMDEKLAKFPSPPVSPKHTPMGSVSTPAAAIVPLTMSTILAEQVEPVAPVTPTKAVEPVVEIPLPTPVPLVFSTIQTVATEPIEPSTPVQSLRPDGVTLPREQSPEDDDFTVIKKEDPETPKPGFLGSVFGWNKGKPSTPIIAEDDTRQSPNQSPVAETPESQRPFKELSNNTNERLNKKPKADVIDESSQTSLTAQQIEEMLRQKSKRQEIIVAEDNAVRGGALRVRKSQESIGSVSRARAKMADPDFVHDTVPIKRPSSAGSNRGSISSNHPPLPTDHKQVIAAASQRVGSSSGGVGTMGPPLIPASAYKSNPSFRPRTPSGTSLKDAPSSVGRAGTTPRAVRQSSGSAEVYSPTSVANRSRRSSVTSFASELDNRFSLRPGMGMPIGFESGADPRMIQAITQTMIGEYLWKYTRKTGRGEMSENRHRRYFWVHPYTRTLYWSDRDPQSAGRAELKAKSVAIDAVRVVTDDNPMPPGLHRKSLVILTPGRTVKFTATTGQRHETWFNALSYLLLRTGADGGLEDTTDVASGALTREDVDEFNPSYGNNRSTRPGPASLSSYNSRTTRNESPVRQPARMSMQPPPLAKASSSSRPSMGTFSRLSGYWKPGERGVMGSFSSRRSRHSATGSNSIYEASEVHDSAEDLREMIEKQDRESDRLEDVRACCDGKFSRDGMTRW